MNSSEWENQFSVTDAGNAQWKHKIKTFCWIQQDASGNKGEIKCGEDKLCIINHNEASPRHHLVPLKSWNVFESSWLFMWSSLSFIRSTLTSFHLFFYLTQQQFSSNPHIISSACLQGFYHLILCTSNYQGWENKRLNAAYWLFKAVSWMDALTWQKAALNMQTQCFMIFLVDFIRKWFLWNKRSRHSISGQFFKRTPLGYEPGNLEAMRAAKRSQTSP